MRGFNIYCTFERNLDIQVMVSSHAGLGQDKKKHLFTVGFLFGSVYASDKTHISGFVFTS